MSAKEWIPVSLKGTYLATRSGTEYPTLHAAKEITLTQEGIEGDVHFGYTRRSTKSSLHLCPLGTEIRNNRQWSAASPSEIKTIEERLELSSGLTAELLGINLEIEGAGPLTSLPGLTYLVFSDRPEFDPQREDNVLLVVYGGILPCAKAGRAIGAALGNPSIETKFPDVALGYRGTMGWVERGGILRPGQNGWILKPT